MPKNKTRKHRKTAPVKKLTDKFVTASGEEMTRRQLSNLVARANYRIEQARNFLTAKEYNKVRDLYESRIATLGLYEPGTQRLTLKGITDPKQLRAIEATARGALSSAYVSKKKYKEIDKKRYESFKSSGLIEDRKQFDLLMTLFKTEAWQSLKDKIYVDSDQLLQLLHDEIFERGETSSKVIEGMQAIIADYADRYAYSDYTENKEIGTASGTWEDGDEYEAADKIWADLDDEMIASELIDELREYLGLR